MNYNGLTSLTSQQHAHIIPNYSTSPHTTPSHLTTPPTTHLPVTRRSILSAEVCADRLQGGPAAAGEARTVVGGQGGGPGRTGRLG